MIEISQKIKSLRTKVLKLLSRKKTLGQERAQIDKVIGGIDKEVHVLNQQIKTLETPNNLRVSEHALVRYFERVKGYDLKEIEKEILEPQLTKMTDTLGGKGTFPNSNGYSVILDGYTVTTIITNKKK